MRLLYLEQERNGSHRLLGQNGFIAKPLFFLSKIHDTKISRYEIKDLGNTGYVG